MLVHPFLIVFKVPELPKSRFTGIKKNWVVLERPE